MSAHERQRLTDRLARQVEQPDQERDQDEQPDPLRVQIERAADKQNAWLQRLFGHPEPEPQPPTRPQGSADGGQGRGPDHETEWVHDDSGPVLRRICNDRN